MKHEITYDYCSEDGVEERNIREEFEGTHHEMVAYINQMKKQGCYNFSVVELED